MTEYQQTAHNEETYSPAIDLRTLLDNLWRALERFGGSCWRLACFLARTLVARVFELHALLSDDLDFYG